MIDEKEGQRNRVNLNSRNEELRLIVVSKDILIHASKKIQMIIIQEKTLDQVTEKLIDKALNCKFITGLSC